MNMHKAVIAGTAVNLFAASGALTADLPVKANPIEYVKVCTPYGAGFFFIPGTDTCLKLNGYFRVDTTFNGSVYAQPSWSGDLGQGNRFRDYFSSRSRMALTIDTRTATEYGVVRTFGLGDFQFTTLGFSTVNPNALNTNLSPFGANLLDTPGGGYVAAALLFVQFAGFTLGKSYSAYATPWHGYPGNNTVYLLGGHDTITGVNNIKYTAEFGSGTSAAIGLDEPTVFHRTSIYNLSIGLPATGTGVIASAYGGVHAPDIVGNIRVDQAWGLFQISGSAHLVNASYNNLNAGTAAPNTLSEISGHPDDKWGGSVMAALQIKNLPTGPGDDIKVDATYAAGKTKDVISTSAASPSFLIYSPAGGGGVAPGAYNSLGFGATTDAIYLPVASGGDGTLHLTKAWGVRGAFNHNWDPYWSSSLFGSYSAVRYDDTAKVFYCGAFIVATGGLATKSVDYSCNPNFNVSQLGVVTRWTPIKNLAFSAEVQWFHLDQKFTGSTVVGAASPKPAARYNFADQDVVSLNVRAQRNF
jgi:hypothetical protein